MGSSATAKIIYGFPFHGDDIEFEDELFHEDPDVWIAHHQGVVKPEGSYDDNKEAHQAYWEVRRNLPLDLEYDGDACAGWGSTFLVVKEATLLNSGATKIPNGHIKFPPPDEWKELLQQFCEKAGLTCNPEWMLISNFC